MKLLRHTVISSWKGQGGHPSQSFPSIARCASGRLAALWRSSPEKNGILDNRVMLSVSEDDGRTWSPARIPVQAPLLDGKPGVFRMGALSVRGSQLLMLLCRVDVSRPERPFFNEANSGLLDCKVYLAISDDEGNTWSEPRLLDSAPYDRQPTPTTGPALVLPDGRIAVQFELNLPYDSTDPWRHLPVLKFSADLGRSFEYAAVPAGDPTNRIFYWDQRPVALADGELVNFYWTWDNAENAYRNITMTSSVDGGRSWSQPRDTGVPGQAGPGFELPDGRLVVPLVDRTARPKIMLRVSTDRGRSFTDEALCLSGEELERQTGAQDDMGGAWREMTAFSLGLPAAVRSAGDTACVIWYAGEATDQTDIHFAEVAL